MSKFLIFIIIASLTVIINAGSNCPLYCENDNCNEKGFCLACKNPFNLNDKGLCQLSNTIQGCQIYSSQPSKNICVKCVNDQVLINGKCSRMPKNCAEIDQTSECKKCLADFQLVGRSCLPKFKGTCPLGHYPYQNYCRPYPIMNCVQKKQGYCQICEKGYSLLNGACIPQGCVVTKCDGCACKGTIMNKNCFDCKPDNCIRSENGFHCDVCESSYVSVGGMCYKPVKYDDVNCNLVDEKAQACTGCNNDYKLDRNNYCVRDFMVSDCSLSRLFDFFEGKCFYKDRNCDKIDANTYQCLYCAQGYSLRAGKCEKTQKCLRRNGNQCYQCLPQLYLHPTKKTCEQKPRNCATFNAEINQCTKCKQPTSMTNLSMGGRVVCATIQPRCMQYNYQGTCISCMSGFVLKNRACMSKAENCQQPNPTDPSICFKCLSGYRLQDSRCYQQSVGCVKFGSDGKCTRCVKDWILVYGRCSYVDKYCLQLDDQGICIRCSQGLMPFGDKCVYYQPFCGSYGLDRMCNKTYSGFNLRYDVSGAAKQEYRVFVLSAVQIKPSNSSSSSSLEVRVKNMNDSKGYYAENGVIQYYPTLSIQSRSVKQMKGDFSILSCYGDYLLISGMCIKKQFMDQNCVEYSPMTSECIKCTKGYDMDYLARCQRRTDATCAERDAAKDICLRCADGYFSIGDHCVSKKVVMARDKFHFQIVEQRVMWPLLPNCLEQKQLGKCLACDIGFTNIQGKCLSYQKYCQNYHPLGFCQKCLIGYSLQGSNCAPMSCLKSQSSRCSSCSTGFQYQSGKCFPAKQQNCIMYIGNECIACQPLYYFSFSTKRCEYAQPNCAVMNPNLNKCSQCHDKYIIYLGSCVLERPNCVQYGLDGSCLKCTQSNNVRYQLVRDGSCLKVPNRCTRLNSQGVCMQCESGYTYTKLGVSSECVIVRQNCITYDSTGRCSKCAQAYTLRNSKCYFLIANCVDSEQISKRCTKCVSSYTLSSDGYCILPDINCKQYKNGYCDSCNSGYHLGASGSGQCQPNPSNCQVYSVKDRTCMMCANNYLLSDGECMLKAMILNGCIDQNRNQANCLVCQTGFTIRDNGLCYANNCLTYTPERNCMECPKYYRKSNRDPRVCQPHFCSIYSQGSTCDVYENDYKGGFVIHGSGRISIQFCTQYDSVSNRCTQCQAYRYPNKLTTYSICYPYNCATQNQLKCSTCKAGYVKSDGACLAQYCQEYTSNGGCRTCAKPYTKNEQGFCASSGPCLEYDSNGVKCKRCQQFYNVIEGQCVAKHCIQQKVDQSQGCAKCKHGFAKTDNGGCKLRYCQVQLLDSFCKQCSPMYRRNSVLGICQPFNCQVYDSQTYTCSKCNPNFQLLQSQCRPKYCAQVKNMQCIKCESGYSVTSTGSCEALNCITFNQQRLCVQCQNGYLLDEKTNLCQIGSSFCVEYDANRNCLKCKAGLVLVNQKNCITQVKGCKNYGPFQCTKCANGLQLKAGTCRVIGCQKQKSALQCEQCIPSYELTKQGLCKVKNCELFSEENWACNGCLGRFSLLMGLCQARNCAMYSVVDQITCLLCEQDFELVDGGCLHKNCINPKQTNCKGCLQGWLPNYKKICSIRDCQNSDFMTGVCTSCRAGKRLSKGVCMGDRCLSRLQNGQCKACDRSFYLINNRQQCVSYFCKLWDNSNGQCQVCIDGFSLKSGVCVNQMCSKFEDKNSLLMPTCVECPDGYIPYNQYCVPKRCRKQGYDPMTASCSSCQFGFEPDNGVCKLKNCNRFAQNSSDFSQCSICRLGFTNQAGLCLTTNCIQYESGTITCNSCHDGYFLFSDICLASNCHNYGDEGQCVECQDQFILQANLTCVRRNCVQDTLEYCTKCQDGYQATYNTNGYCKPVNCQNIDAQSNSCKQCVNGLVQDNGICKDIQCEQFAQNYQCQKCRRGFKMSAKGVCQLQVNSFCPPGQFFSEVRSMCQRIQIPYCKYVENNQPNVCIQCMEGYFMQAGICQSVAGCSKFSLIDGCSECEYGLQLVNKRCTNSDSYCLVKLEGKCAICKQSYYLNQNKQCVPKPINCQQQSADRKCLKCQKSFSLISQTRGCQASNCAVINQQNLKCKQCSAGFTLTKNQTCQGSLNANCKTQKDGSCIKCQEGYTVYNKMCVRIIQNCQDYSSATSQCTKCKIGFTPKSNKCVEEVEGCDMLGQNGGCLICKYGYIKSETTNKCMLAKEYCKEFDGKGVCKKCKDGYHLRVDFLCYENPLNCVDVNSMGVCLKCGSGFMLGLQNSCFKAVQQASKAASQATDVISIKIQASQIEKSTQKSQINTTNTKTTQTETTKQTVKPKISQDSISYIENCLFQDDIKKVCVICNIDYYITESGKCLPLPANCRYTNFKGMCISCAQGFNLQKGTCIEGQSNGKQVPKTDQIKAFEAIDKTASNLRNPAKL